MDFPSSSKTLVDRLRALTPDLSAAGAVFFLGVPQGLAYATIAGLPPAMGLYAATFPAIVGSLFRSSRHVVVGPTNALSLLVGGAVLAMADHPPLEVAIALSLGVAAVQLLATVLRLSAIVDYISSPTVLGYITGAGVLIGVGQLHNFTGTSGPGGKLWQLIPGWVEQLPHLSELALAVAVGTVIAIVLLRLLARRIQRKLPAALLVMLLGIVVNLALGLEARGLRVVADLAPIPAGLPPLTLPSLELTWTLAPFVFACAVLSLVESTSVARSISARTGQRLDVNREFLGQGLANLSAAFFAGYPVSGSLSRSALNEQAGARTRASAVLTGVMMLGVLLLLASFLDHTPIASLAGTLMVVAWDLVDVPRIRKTFETSGGDALAFAVTMSSTWILPLDRAIYLGVAVSLILFLRKARLLTVQELVVNPAGLLQEHNLDEPLGELRRCEAVRLIHIEGALFFGSASELVRTLDAVAAEPEVRVILLRVKRTSSFDFTAAEAIAALAESMRERDKHLLLVGMTPSMMSTLRRSGLAEALGEDKLFPTRERWLEALGAARDRAFELSNEIHDDSCALRHARVNPLDAEEDSASA